MNIYLLNNYYLKSSMSDEAFSAYLALRRLCWRDQSIHCFSSSQLYFELSGELPETRYLEERITAGVNELSNLKMIYITAKKNGLWIADLSPLFFNKTTLRENNDFYTVVEHNDIHTVFKQARRPFTLVRFYCYIISTLRPCELSDKYLIGTKAKTLISTELGLSYHTVSRYFLLLEELKLIHVYHSQCMISTNSFFTSLPNTYGRYCDYNLIDNYGKLLDGKSPHSFTKNKNANLFRSASAKYAAFIKGHPYSVQDLKAIYIIMQEYNRRQKEPERKKDLSVFSSYPFYDPSIQ